jgi:hypothetical protein
MEIALSRLSIARFALVGLMLLAACAISSGEFGWRPNR